MKRCKKIKSGDVIGVIAVSSPCDPVLFEKGLAYIREAGFGTKTVLDPCSAYSRNTYLFSSDTPEARAKALEELFLDASVSAIISARGAYGVMEILNLIDFDLVKKHPKYIVGFSDTTALLIAINKLCRFPVVHGPAVSGSFARAAGEADSETSVRILLDLLKGDIEQPFEGLSFENTGAEKRVRGKALGGSLTMICSLLGTPYEPDTDGAVLFLEEVGEKPYRIARMLMHLKLSGKFKGVEGIVLGDFKDCTHTNGPQVKDVLSFHLEGLGIPVYRGVPFGHGSLNVPVIIGAEVELREGEILFR